MNKPTVLSQRLVRDNPGHMARSLARRGIDVDIGSLQAVSRQERDLEDQRIALQAEGNRIGREVGKLIKLGFSPKEKEIAELRRQGNAIKQQVAELEEREKELGFT